MGYPVVKSRLTRGVTTATLQLLATQPWGDLKEGPLQADTPRPGALHPNPCLPTDAGPDSAPQDGSQLSIVGLAGGYFFLQLAPLLLLGTKIGLQIRYLCLAAVV